jgi:hypothetical protein
MATRLHKEINSIKLFFTSSYSGNPVESSINCIHPTTIIQLTFVGFNEQ